jgi:fumarate reductase flavoprotein subunit
MGWHDWLNLKNLIAVSRVIALSALAREDSRGAHFREDFPDTGDLDGSRYIVVRQRGDELNLSREPVRFTRVVPGQSLLADA